MGEDDFEYALEVIVNAILEKSMFGCITKSVKLGIFSLGSGNVNGKLYELLNSITQLSIQSMNRNLATAINERIESGCGYNIRYLGGGNIHLEVED
jgi:hypothetical protein